MTRRINVLTIATVIATLWAAHAPAGSPASPNIVYILADDMGVGDVMAYNKDSKFPTPHIDRMASEGMLFTDAHTNSSVCTPTRYGILTGRYAWRTHLKSGVTNGHSPHLIDPARETVASFMKKQGYQTAVFGKWHLGQGPAHEPTGFDAWRVIPGQGLYHDPEFIDLDGKRD